MDWSEDKVLLEKLEKIEKLEVRHKEIAELKEQLSVKQKELDHRFKIITEQADIIKRYRCLVKNLKLDETINALESSNSSQEQKSFITDIEGISPVPEVLNNNGELLNNEPPAIEILNHNVVLQNDVELKEKIIVKKRPREDEKQPHSKIKLRRLNEIAEQNQIKFPTADDMNYKDTAIGQTIWSTIVKCFRKYPGGMITENMIIEEGGKHVFNPKEYFLDKKMIHKYFTHPFKYKEDDKKMSIRPVLMAHGLTSWMVLIPDWLKAEFREEMCNYSQ